MVESSYRNIGVGKEIVAILLKEAIGIGLKRVLVLTFKAKLFEAMDFIQTDKENMPNQKIWQDCIKCKFFPKCEEVLLIKNL